MYDRVAHLYDATRGWPKEVERLIGAGLYYLLAEAAEVGEPLVLEIGVGTGRVAVPLAAHGARVYGVDVSGEMLALLAEKSAGLSRAGFPQRVAAAMADAQDLPFADGAFDAGLVVHVLHRLPDWRRGLAELCRVVRPGGAILFGIDQADEDEGGWVSDRWDEIVAYETGAVQPPEPDRIAVTHGAAGALRDEGYGVEEHVLARWIVTRTPADIVSRFRQRSFSSSWDLPEEVVERAARRIEAELLEYFGSLEVELEREQRFKVLMARRAGG